MSGENKEEISPEKTKSKDVEEKENEKKNK